MRAVVAALVAVAVAPADSTAFSAAEIAAAAGVAREVEADVGWLAADALEGRGSGTAAGAQAAELLIDALEPLGAGLGAGEGRDAYRQPFDGVRANLLAVIPGGARADEVVLVGAHYDHLTPGACYAIDDTICNGATDNAAGVAAVLAIGRAARAAASRRRARSCSRSGIARKTACWAPSTSRQPARAARRRRGVRELRHPGLEPVSERARQELRHRRRERRRAAHGAGRRGDRRGRTRHAAALDHLRPGTQRLRSHPRGEGTDRLLLRRDQACYHTSGDEIDVVDFRKLARQSEIGFRLALGLAESAERPTLEPVTQLDRFEDLVVLSDVLTAALADLDVLHPFYAADLIALEAEAREKVEAGPDAFGPTDALLLALGALDIATNGLACDPLLVPEPAAGPVALLALLGLVRRASRRPLAAGPARPGASRSVSAICSVARRAGSNSSKRPPKPWFWPS